MSRENFLAALNARKDGDPVELDDLTDAQLAVLLQPEEQRLAWIADIREAEDMASALPNLILPVNATVPEVKTNMSFFRVMEALSKQLLGVPMSERDARRYFAQHLGDMWDSLRVREVFFWADRDNHTLGRRLREMTEAEYLAHVQTPQFGIGIRTLAAVSAVFGVNFVLSFIDRDNTLEYFCLDRGSLNDVYAVISLHESTYLFDLYQRDVPEGVNEMPARVFTLDTLPAAVRTNYAQACTHLPAPLDVV